jgi:hypothetical protein
MTVFESFHHFSSRRGLLSVAFITLGLLTLAGAGATSSRRAATPGAAADEPVPVWYISWTATASGTLDTTDSSGNRTVLRRRVVMTGSAIQRRYPDGSHDNYPFQLTVSDEEDRVDTSPCPEGGFDRTHTFKTITDPNRYPDPNYDPNNVDPLINDAQRSDGSWYIIEPFVGFYGGSGTRDFNYRTDADGVDCDGESGSMSSSGPNFDYSAPLSYPTGEVKPGVIEGDANGNVFQLDVTRQWSLQPWVTVHWKVTIKRLLGRDLTVNRLEITQGLQDGANLIPMVQDRRTVVRAYLGVGIEQEPIPGVTGRLTGYSGSTPLGSVPPFNPGGRITAPAWPDWHQIDHTLNFELPLAWTEQPGLRLEVEVNDDRSVTEIDYTNNKLSEAVSTVSCFGLSIAFVPVHYTPPEGYTPAFPSGNIHRGQEFMRKIFPIPDKELKYSQKPNLRWTKSLSTDAGSSELLKELHRQLLKSSARRADRIYGWTPSKAFPDNGWAGEPGTDFAAAAFGNDTETPNKWRRTFAHEIAHLQGLDHTHVSPPYYQNTSGYHWFDVYERKIKPANSDGELLDVMFPDKTEPEAWISPGSYAKLMSEMCVGGTATPSAAQAATAADNLLVSGTIFKGSTPTGSLDPLYRITTAPVSVPRPPQGGPGYCIKLKNNATLLSQTCFDVSFDTDGGPVSRAPFGMVIPYPAGLNRVELTRGTTTLSTRTASPNPPTVAVTFPNAPSVSLSGEQTITWTGSDPNGDSLTYEVLYSRDNAATWIGVGSGTTGNSYTLDFSSLPGGANALIKVMVSDGFWSAEDVSDNPFSVANKPPTAVITSPPSAASFNANTMITLQGAGMDLEDGFMSDSALSWTSDRDGLLGTGQLLEKLLSLGTHVITLTATDLGGLKSSAAISVNVVPVAPAPTPTPTPAPTPPTPNPAAPVIFIEEGTVNRAVALDSVTFVHGPFRILTDHNFSADRHTRVIIFTSNLGLSQPDSSILTVQAAGFPLTVENVGMLTGVPGLDVSYIVVRLPDGLPAGNLPLTVTLRGVISSNAPTLGILPP